MAQGIHPDTVLRHLKVQVRPGGVAGGSGDTDHIPLVHILPHLHLPAGHVGIQRGIAAAVGDDHIVAVGAAVLGHDDRAGLGCVDGAGVTHPADVRTLVVGGADTAGRVPSAHGGGDVPAVHRPDVAAWIGLCGLAVGGLLGHQLVAEALGLRPQGVLLRLQICQCGLRLVLVGGQLLDDGVGLAALGVQLILLC